MTFLPQVGIQLPSAASTTGPLRLEIVGDLDELLKGWSEEENLAGRRKVDFLKFQNGRTIVTTFAPVLHEDAVPSELRISIVKFGEMTEPCFTYFDFLRLLGYLLPIPINDSERFRHVLRNRSRSHYTREISPKNEEFSTLVSFEEPAVVDARTKQLVYSWRMLSLALEKAVQLVLLHLCVNGELS